MHSIEFVYIVLVVEEKVQTFVEVGNLGSKGQVVQELQSRVEPVCFIGTILETPEVIISVPTVFTQICHEATARGLTRLESTVVLGVEHGNVH